MSYCLNPLCAFPDDAVNHDLVHCVHCGSLLLVSDRYRVQQLLSDSSGFARIFEVTEIATGEAKILKVLKPQHHDNDKVVKLFQQEAAVLSDLDHPGIPKVDPPGYFPYWPHHQREPLHCFVMEKIDGPNLWQWMHQQGNLLINQQQALNWLRQIAEILHLVHQKNYFHRDIKLQNIMLRSSGQLVLIDFGAAREMTYTYLLKTGRSGSVTKVSSAGYTPPEQEQGHAVPQSDFFALGRTFVYLLTGKRLDDHDMYNPLTNELRWREHAPDLSPALADFIDHLMAPRAADRPANTQVLLDAIARLQAELHPYAPTVPVSLHCAASPSRLPRTALQISPDQPTVSQSPFGSWPLFSHWAQAKYRWLLGIAAALTLGVGGYGGWQAYHATVLLWGRGNQVAQQQVFAEHTSFVNDLLVSPDSQWLVSASADQTLKIWDLATGRLQQTLSGHQSFVNTVLISADGRYLLSGSADQTIKVWDKTTGELQRTLRGHTNSVDRLRLSPDGSRLVSTSADRTIRIWDWQAGKLLHTLTGHQGFVNAIAIATDGQTLVSGSADKTLKIWDLESGTERQTLEGHTSFVNTLAVSPDGQWLASGGADRTIRIWNLQTGAERQVLRQHQNFINDLAISPDGRWLVSASADKTIRIWELTTGALHQTLTAHQGYVNRVKITQDGRFLLSSSADQTIRLWDLPSGKLRKTLTGYTEHINDFALSPDDQWVMTGSGGKDIVVWSLELERD